LKEILKLCREFHSCRTSTNNHLIHPLVTDLHHVDITCPYHMQQTLLLLFALILEHGSFNAIHEPGTNLLSIRDLLQETRMLLHARNTCETVSVSLELTALLLSSETHTECSILCSNSND